MVLSIEGWIDGITASLYVLVSFSCGLGIIFQARKLNAKLLLFMGIAIFLAGFYETFKVADFINILIMGININNPHIFVILSDMFLPIILLISFYIGSELILPKKKGYFLAPFIGLTILFEILLLFNAGLLEFNFYGGKGEFLFDSTNANVITFRLKTILGICAILFCGFGYLIKSMKSRGIVKKKILFLSIGYFLFIGSPIIISFSGRILEIFLNDFIILIYSYLIRVGMISSFWFFYHGLKEEHEIIFIDPEIISEEEMILLTEKNLCLVCKEELSGFQTFACKCGTLYHDNCAHSLEKPENICWKCGVRIDTKETKTKIKRSTNKDNLHVISGFLRVLRANVKDEDLLMVKEEKKCLICKADIKGFKNYACKCGVLYHEKCALAIIKMENACWSCEHVIDENFPLGSKEIVSDDDASETLNDFSNKKFKPRNIRREIDKLID